MSQEPAPGPSEPDAAPGPETGDTSGGERTHKTKLSTKKLEKLKKEYEKRGVVYLSRLPPHMASDSKAVHRLASPLYPL